MYLPDFYSAMVFDGQSPAVASLAAPADASAIWDRVARPSYAWSQLADIAIEQDNIPEAIAMIEFAYWAADASEVALPDFSSGYEQKTLLNSSKCLGVLHFAAAEKLAANRAPSSPQQNCHELPHS